MRNVCLQTYGNNRLCQKSGLLFKKMQNNPSSLRVKNAEFSGYCFYMNPYISRNFQICISVPLTPKKRLSGNLLCHRNRNAS